MRLFIDAWLAAAAGALVGGVWVILFPGDFRSSMVIQAIPLKSDLGVAGLTVDEVLDGVSSRAVIKEAVTRLPNEGGAPDLDSILRRLRIARVEGSQCVEIEAACRELDDAPVLVATIVGCFERQITAVLKARVISESQSRVESDEKTKRQIEDLGERIRIQIPEYFKFQKLLGDCEGQDEAERAKNESITSSYTARRGELKATRPDVLEWIDQYEKLRSELHPLARLHTIPEFVDIQAVRVVDGPTPPVRAWGARSGAVILIGAALGGFAAIWSNFRARRSKMVPYKRGGFAEFESNS